MKTSRQREEIVINILKHLRQASGLTQSDVAHLLRRPQSFVSKYESGIRRLDLLEVYDLCQIFGVQMTEFIRQLEEELQRIHDSTSDIQSSR